MPSNNIFICSFNGRYDNLGDVVIFNNLIEKLSNHGLVFYAGVNQPIQNREIAHVNSTQMIAKYISYKLKGYNLYFFNSPGGVVAHNEPTGSPSFKLKAFLRASMLFGLGVRMCWVGFSLERKPLSIPVRGFYWLGPRDSNTLDLLSEVKSKYCGLFSDLALLTDLNAKKSGRDSIILSYRDPGEQLREELVAKLRLLLISLQRDNSVFLEVKIFYQVEEDHDFCRQLGDSLKDFNPTFTPDALNFENYTGFYEKAKYVISNRLHCLLFGAINGGLPVAFTRVNHLKIVSFFEVNKLSALFLDVEGDAWPLQISEISRKYDSNLKMVGDFLASSPCNASAICEKVLK